MTDDKPRMGTRYRSEGSDKKPSGVNHFLCHHDGFWGPVGRVELRLCRKSRERLSSWMGDECAAASRVEEYNRGLLTTSGRK